MGQAATVSEFMDQFMARLKAQDLMIVPRALVEQNMVDGMPLDQYRKKILRNNMLSLSQISKARLWGKIGPKAVYTIVMKHVPENEIVKINTRLIKIPRETVKSIAASRGFEI